MTKAKDESLATYRKKRNFKKTPEPGGVVAKAKGNSYLIQKHEASHLHYDLRLELNGVLKSWAVPKGPSPDPAVKRLAMQVEDHPVAYGSFEGIIPKGEYGGGTVMLWDTGTWEPVGDAQDGIAKGKLVFKVYGERVKGEWTLVKTHGRVDTKGNTWLLIKHHDEEERPGTNDVLVTENVTSVVSGRTMKEIAAEKDRVWQSNKNDKTKSVEIIPKKAKMFVTRPTLNATGDATKGLPGFLEPQLATLSDAVPDGKNWIHEIKFDGYRMLAYVENNNVRMISRNDKDWTNAFAPLAEHVANLPVKTAIFDGEVVALSDNNKSSFSELKDALSDANYARMQYYIFDLLFLNGLDIRERPLTERKALLKEVIGKIPTKSKKRVLYSNEFDNADGKFFQCVCNLQLEGVISKRADSPYSGGRGKSWLKTKCIKREEFVVGGYVKPTNGSLGIGSLLLGYYENGQLMYAGKVGTGWNNETSLKLRKTLDKLIAPKMAYAAVPTEGRRGAIWVNPKLVCEIEFTEWTPDAHLRHPSFEGLRDDKSAKDVKRDIAQPVKAAEIDADKELKKNLATTSVNAKRKEKKSSTPKSGEESVDNIRISHPDRIIYPDSHITKLQLAEYYSSIADNILPYVANRPMSMVRCPEGIGSECFFQRHVGLGKSAYLHEVAIGVKGDSREYMMIKDVEGLISLVQWGVIELHPWQCDIEHLTKPNQIIFDLDPDPEVNWKSLMAGANEVRQRMEELGLRAFLKTTGGKGLHVVIPITPTYSFPAIKSFGRAIADSMASDSPTKYIATMSKEKRKGKIFIDYLRNDVTSTAVAPYSARARAGATVSTPLAWDELTSSLKLSGFTIESVPLRLKKMRKDPWEDFGQTRQKIAAKYLKALKINPE